MTSGSGLRMPQLTANKRPLQECRTLDSHLGAGVFVLRASTEQVSGQQDTRDGRSPALLAHIPQIPGYSVHQQLQSQHALCLTAPQTQT